MRSVVKSLCKVFSYYVEQTELKTQQLNCYAHLVRSPTEHTHTDSGENKPAHLDSV